MKMRAAMVFGFLVSMGGLQIVAETFGWTRIKDLAAAAQVSPAMKVFTAHQQYETHAAKFSLSWREGDADHKLTLDPASYAHVKGPYNRRNVYGAALAYGPLLRNDPRLKALQESVTRYGFCSPGTLRAELGIPLEATHLRIHITPIRKSTRDDLELSWAVDCNE